MKSSEGLTDHQAVSLAVIRGHVGVLCRRNRRSEGLRPLSYFVFTPTRPSSRSTDGVP